MAKRKEEETFTVSDRRKFSTEGELRSETEAAAETSSKNLETSAASAIHEVPPPVSSGPPATDAEPLPEPPSEEQRSVQADAYQRTNRQMDDAISKEMGPSVADLEVTFERFVGSLYMSSIMQLGLAHEPNGQPQLDIISARQTIDTIGLLAEKTKGNLTATEQNFLQNALYELRMAYLEVTNALARGPLPGAPGSEPGRAKPGPGSPLIR